MTPEQLAELLRNNPEMRHANIRTAVAQMNGEASPAVLTLPYAPSVNQVATSGELGYNTGEDNAIAPAVRQHPGARATSWRLATMFDHTTPVAVCKCGDPPSVLPAVSGVYLIVNRANGKFYVGSTVNLRARWAGHRSGLESGRHHNPHLQAAWQKYGASAFEFLVVEVVAQRADILPAEQRWLDRLDAAIREDSYNCCAVAGSHLGRKRSEETRRRLAEKQRGIAPSAETRAKMRAAKLGRSLSAEHKAKIGAAGKGKKIHRAPGYSSYGHRLFTVEQVQEMRRLKAEGWSYSQIEQRFGVSHGGLQRIIRRDTYRDC